MSKLDDLIKELCPGGVEYKKLGDIGNVCMCKRILKSQTSSDVRGVPFYKIGTFGGEADAFITWELYEEYKKKYSYPNKGDILISAAGTIGRTVVYGGEPAYFQDSNIVWLSNDESQVMNSFLYYCYQMSPWCASSGGTIARLYNDNIMKAKIPVPPLEVQREVVRVLDTFTLLTAELKAELAARKQQYEFYRHKLLNGTENCKVVQVGDVCDVYTGGEPPKDCIKGEKSDEKHPYAIWGNGKEVYGYAGTYRIDKDAVVISSIGANTGAVYFRKAFFTPIIRLKVVVPKTNELDMRFLFHALSATEIKSKSSSVPNMNANEIKKIKLHLPNVIEQKRIVDVLDRFDVLCSDMTDGIPAEIEARQKQYEYYRNKILSFGEIGDDE